MRLMVFGAGVVMSQVLKPRVPELTTIGSCITSFGIQVVESSAWEASMGPELVPMARDKSYVACTGHKTFFKALAISQELLVYPVG